MRTTALQRRIDRVDLRRPAPAPTYDLSRLTDGQFGRLDQLRERILLVGEAGLTPDEMHEAAELVRCLTAGETL